MPNLFLICPDCYIEEAIRNHYGKDNYLLTSLGTVFEIDSFEYAEDLNQLILDGEISSIFIVNDFRCTFIQNELFQKGEFNTKAESVIRSLINNNFEAIGHFKTIEEKSKKVAELNINRQAFELLEVAFIGNKIRDGMIKVFGLIYDRDKHNFYELQVEV